ncbi:alpha/beta hydrolase [Streptomyces sp. NPDC054933]
MPLHAEMERFLAVLTEQSFPPLERASVPALRELMGELRRVQGPPEPVAATIETMVSGPCGRLPVRVYQPPARPGPRPLLVFFHGGGWIAGNVELLDRPLRRLANASGAVVASVEYRLAPETQFPGPAHDAYAAICALAERAGELGAEPGRLVVGGESAGANLATVACQMVRERGGPRIDLQVLVCPVTAPAHESAFRSYHDHATGYLNTRAAMTRFWELYLPDPHYRSHPLAAPLLARDLTGQPPALILTAEYDPVRDEGEEYGRRLRAAGTAATISRYNGMIHVFFLLTELGAFQQAIDEISQTMRSRFGD